MLIKTRKGNLVNTPDIRLTTKRKCKRDTKKADKWLLETVKEEYKNDEWASFQLSLMDLNNLSPCDKDVLMDMLLPDGASQYIYRLVM